MVAGRLCVTGVVRIEDGGDERTLRGSQPRLVLARTALVAGHPVPADALALALWPVAPTHWEGAVRGVVAKVRSFLGADAVLENIGHCYRFRTGLATVDVEDAARALTEAETAMGERRWDDAAAAADSAAALLADPVLPGVDAEWLLPWRTRLERRCDRARRAGALAHSALGHHDEARDRAEAAVEHDPFDEASHRTLMGVLLAGGDRSGALLAYERLRRLLADELGVEPDSETQATYDQAVQVGVPLGDER